MTYKEGMEEWVKGCQPKSKSELQPNQLNFYEYKQIRHILIKMLEFREKNGLNERGPVPGEKIPHFILEFDYKHIQKLVDKMTARMKEFEPWISKNTTAHCGYWEV